MQINSVINYFKVLRAVADCIAINTSKNHCAPIRSIHFRKAGEKHRVHAKTRSGLLSKWLLKVDLGKWLTFPPHIAITSLRPDMIISSSEATKQLMNLVQGQAKGRGK